MKLVFHSPTIAMMLGPINIRSPLIRTLVIRIGLALQVNILLQLYYSLLRLTFLLQLSNTYEELHVKVLFVCKLICSLKSPFVEFFSPLQAASVAYFQRKIQLPGFSAYPDGSRSQLIRISGVLVYIANI